MLTQTIFREALLQQMTSLTCFHLESDSPFQKKICVICFIESPLKMIENAFYFILKALFTPKIFKFFS